MPHDRTTDADHDDICAGLNILTKVVDPYESLDMDDRQRLSRLYSYLLRQLLR